jgi:hypothetical protein
MCLLERIYTYQKRSTESKEDKIMWEKGTLLIEGTTVKYCIKHYTEPSEDYGIDGGRISKMQLKVNGETTLNYDRGWDIEPEDEASQLACGILIRKYN